MSNSDLNIYCWNANSITNKFEEILLALHENKIDILAINETKINVFDEKNFFDKNYYCVFKSRNRHGGGVGFLIKKEIEFVLINDLNKFEKECLCLKLKVNGIDVMLINYYNSPSGVLCYELLEFININFKNFIICGDLNSKSIDFGCKESNNNGKILTDFLLNSRAIVLNNHEPTFFRDYTNYTEILDLFICSNSLYKTVTNFEVCVNVNLFSDHYPIKIQIKRDNKKKKMEMNNRTSMLDYSKANWIKFKNYLESIDLNLVLKSYDVNEINDFIVTHVQKAASASIPLKYNNTVFHTKIPSYLRKLVKHKKYLLKKKYENNSNSNLNLFSKIIKTEINILRNNSWMEFANKMQENPLASKKFWRRIDKINNNGKDKISHFPTLNHNNKQYKTDTEKANLFGSILSETFNDNEDDKYDKEFKAKINREINLYLNQPSNSILNEDIINGDDLKKIIKKLKTTLSSGEDLISNIMIKNIGDKFLKIFVHLFNLSIKNGKIPARWKKVNVKMIPKKADAKSNPINYRPISLTNCIARLCERVILRNVQEHLKTNNIIVKQQSGFRAHRQTKDNLFNLIQKNFETFNRKMKNCVVFFDISKAFDKVWHNGLLYKMKKHFFEKFIIVWVAEFLKDRNYQVFINDSMSKRYTIEVGVPQGGVLSPILFSIYINDIIFDKTQYKKTKTESTLFADDLATSCASNKIHIIEKIFKLYMNKLENWLIKWRLSINPNKCQIILFNRGKSEKINIALLNENIPVTNEIKFLGLIIDRTMHFTNCIKDIKIKCNNRLNILKILSHKSWNLTSKILCCIYQILIRSIIDYASVIFNMLNETNKKKLRSIQYHALRHAMRKPLKASHSELLEISKICSIDKRCYELNESFLFST